MDTGEGAGTGRQYRNSGVTMDTWDGGRDWSVAQKLWNHHGHRGAGTGRQYRTLEPHGHGEWGLGPGRDYKVLVLPRNARG